MIHDQLIYKKRLIKMTKVYIVNKSVHDYSDAERYGELVFLSTGNLKRFSTSKAYRKFWPILSQSGPKDYLLVSGMPMLCIIAAFIMSIKHKRLNLLLFNPSGTKKEYLERILIGD